MKTIRRQMFILLSASGAGLLICIASACPGIAGYPYGTESAVAFSVLVTLFLITVLILKYDKYKKAGLIIENRIMHIEAVKIMDCVTGRSGASRGVSGIDVYISCFGILLNTRVIKFNLGGIRLKSVEMGRESICLVYGTEKRLQKTRILHEKIRDQEMQYIMEKFRHETGILPVIAE